jgi:hypothetical protein
VTAKEERMSAFLYTNKKMEGVQIWDLMSLQSVIPLESPRRVLSGEVEESMSGKWFPEKFSEILFIIA